MAKRNHWWYAYKAEADAVEVVRMLSSATAVMRPEQRHYLSSMAYRAQRAAEQARKALEVYDAAYDSDGEPVETAE